MKRACAVRPTNIETSIRHNFAKFLTRVVALFLLFLCGSASFAAEPHARKASLTAPIKAGAKATVKKALHWDFGDLPLKVYFVPATKVAGYKAEFGETAKQAFFDWNKESQGLTSFVFVDQVKDANMIVRWSEKQTKDMKALGARTCGIARTISFATHSYIDKRKRAQLIARCEIVMLTKWPHDFSQFSVDDVHGTALHEIGHALGLPHSASKSDIMFPGSNSSRLSRNDVVALISLYESEKKLHERKVLLYNTAVDQFNSAKYEAAWDSCVQVLHEPRRFDTKAWHILRLIEQYAKNGQPEVRPLLAHVSALPTLMPAKDPE
ncbi:MAG: matrixin family metalloprotease [Candidatus Obscuribacterales bacterium]|nr:matrixin family metalloprotease [Candidatus Obscuribacterales bacterium]